MNLASGFLTVTVTLLQHSPIFTAQQYILYIHTYTIDLSLSVYMCAYSLFK